MPSRFVPLNPNTDDAQRVAVINKNFAELDAEGVKKIYYGEDGLPRIYIDGTQGTIKTAPAGTDVTTATDSELTFNSSQNVFKIIATGTLTVNYAASTGIAEATIAHGLSHIPAAQVFVDLGGVYQPTPLNAITTAGLTYAVYDWYATATDFTVRLLKYNVVGGTYASDSTVNFKYYLFVESAN